MWDRALSRLHSLPFNSGRFADLPCRLPILECRVKVQAQNSFLCFDPALILVKALYFGEIELLLGLLSHALVGDGDVVEVGDKEVGDIE